MGVNWNESERKYLKDNWLKKRTVSIADDLGKTRNAVIGQANRMGLPRKGRPEHFRPERVKSPNVVPLLKPKPNYEGPIPLVESTVLHCKAVVEGKDENGLAMICGKPVVIGQAFSFCSEHLKKYTVRGLYR